MTRVLFVCVQNSCRSQMAEAFARQQGREAHSAGSRPSGVVSLRAIESMGEVGYDLATHRSKSLDEIPDGAYAAVITMGCGDVCSHVDAELREDWEISDPKAMSPDEFRCVRDEIERRVNDLFERLG